MRVSKLCLLGIVFCVASWVGAPTWAQVDPCTQQIIVTRPGRSRPAEAEDAQREEMRRTQQKKMNEERQASLKKDTEELYNLATQLKEGVDKSTQNTLSVDVIRTAQQIEKLAKSVRERMKGNLYCDLKSP